MRQEDFTAQPNHAQEFCEVQRLFRQDLNVPIRGLIRQLLEQTMRDHVANQVQAGWHERQGDRRRGFRNGTYARRRLTTVGEVVLDVPRTREHPSPATVILPAYARRMPQVDAMLRQVFLHGSHVPDLARQLRAAVLRPQVSPGPAPRLAHPRRTPTPPPPVCAAGPHPQAPHQRPGLSDK